MLDEPSPSLPYSYNFALPHEIKQQEQQQKQGKIILALG